MEYNHYRMNVNPHSIYPHTVLISERFPMPRSEADIYTDVYNEQTNSSGDLQH